MEQPARNADNDFMARIFVQDEDTHLFLDCAGKWTNRLEEACDFPTTVNAIVHCVQRGIVRIQLVVQVEKPKLRNVVVKLADEDSERARSFGAGRSDLGSR